jgi:hypothetical protein
LQSLRWVTQAWRRLSLVLRGSLEISACALVVSKVLYAHVRNSEINGLIAYLLLGSRLLSFVLVLALELILSSYLGIWQHIELKSGVMSKLMLVWTVLLVIIRIVGWESVILLIS